MINPFHESFLLISHPKISLQGLLKHIGINASGPFLRVTFRPHLAFLGVVIIISRIVSKKGLLKSSKIAKNLHEIIDIQLSSNFMFCLRSESAKAYCFALLMKRSMSYWRFIVLLFLIVVHGAAAQVDPSAEEGVLDASTYDFSSEPLKLNGEWLFYWNDLLTPPEIALSTEVNYTTFPEPWTEAVNGQGYATYKLTLMLNPRFRDYSIEMPQLYSAYSLWINGKLVAKNGVVGTDRKTSQPQWLPQMITIKEPVDTLSLVLQVSNFTHSTGGLKNPIVIGLTENLSSKRYLAEVVNKVLLGTLTFIGLFFLNVYFFVRREKSILYFALMCVVWAMRSIFSELYLAIQWMPWFDWELAVKIEYITIHLEVAFAMLLISRLYPLDTNTIVKNTLVYPNFLFAFFTMASPAVLYTQLLNVYLIFAGLVIVYVMFIIMRAIVFERYGAWFSVLGIVAGITAFSYNILSYEGVFDFNPLFYYSWYIVIYLFLAIALAYQLNPKAKEKNTTDKLTLEDFMGNNR
jgi:hypothetical protein